MAKECQFLKIKQESVCIIPHQKFIATFYLRNAMFTTILSELCKLVEGTLHYEVTRPCVVDNFNRYHKYTYSQHINKHWSLFESL